MNLKDYTNLYPVSKTLRFRLLPVGMTEQNMEMYLKDDHIRNAESEMIKQIITRYDQDFIKEALEGFELKGLDDLANDLNANSKDSKAKKNIDEQSDKIRTEISAQFEKHAKDIGTELKKITAGEVVKLIKKDEDKYCIEEGDKEALEHFQKFSTYLKDYAENRKNIYSDEKIPSAAAYRMINENFPRFVNNI